MAFLALHFWRETTLIFLLILMQLNLRVNCVPTQDKEALLAFMSEIPHEKRVHWNANDSVCNWFGVQCDSSHSFVESLHLPGVGLVGPIPPNTIGRLTQLRVLSLRHNALTGEIPADFSNLTHLRNLYLQNNNFSGDFPISLIRLSRLARLDLSLNNLTGSIPSSIVNLTHLTGVFLQNNRFTNSLPSFTNKLINFNVSNNRLNGSIPESLTNFPPSSFTGNVDLCGGTLKPCNPFLLSPVLAPSSLPVPSQSPMLSPSSVPLYSPLQSPSSVLPPIVNAKSKTNNLSIGTIVILFLMSLFGHPFVVCSIVVALLLMLILFLCFCCRSAKPPQAEVAEAPGDALVAVEEGTSSHLRFQRNRESGRTPLDWNTRMRIAIGTARDLALLHISRKSVHGNLNSSNILLGQNLNPIFQNSSTEANHLTGYPAPELLETQQPTFQSDVYSFGVLLLELLTRKAPNQESLGMEDLPRWVQSVVGEEWTTEVFDAELMRYRSNEEEMIHLLKIGMKCASVLPDQRPTMQEVVYMIEAIDRSEIDEELRQSSDAASNGSHGHMPPQQSRSTPRTNTASYYLTNKGKVLLRAEKWRTKWVGGSS